MFKDRFMRLFKKKNLVPFSTLDIFEHMNSQKLTFLLAIIKALDNNNKKEISFIEALKKYYVLCESYSLKPRSDSQLWQYLQEFKRNKIILFEIISERIKDKRVRIKIPGLILPILEKKTIEILNSKGFKI